MSDRVIKLVQGDTRPIVTLALTDEETGAAIDLSAASTTVVHYFRKAGTTTLLATLACSKVGDGTNGQITFKFDNNVLANLAAGDYEGETEISYNGEKHTVYDVQKYKLRAAFA